MVIDDPFTGPQDDLIKHFGSLFSNTEYETLALCFLIQSKKLWWDLPFISLIHLVWKTILFIKFPTNSHSHSIISLCSSFKVMYPFFSFLFCFMWCIILKANRSLWVFISGYSITLYKGFVFRLVWWGIIYFLNYVASIN